MKKLLYWLTACLFPLMAFAQNPTQPEDEGNGIPGTRANSFQISWSRHPQATAYEYLVTDNPLCFAGCAGDTRQEIVSDTTAIEFDMQDQIWYYWIVRAIIEGQDTTAWTKPVSFFSLTPDAERIGRIYPNPVTNDILGFQIDWGIQTNARTAYVEIFSLTGKKIGSSHTFTRSIGSNRFEYIRMGVPQLAQGIYIAMFSLEGVEQKTHQKFVVFKPQ